MNVLCPKCDQEMIVEVGLINYFTCFPCMISYDPLYENLWYVYTDDLICKGSIEYCRKFFKLKVFS